MFRMTSLSSLIVFACVLRNARLRSFTYSRVLSLRVSWSTLWHACAQLRNVSSEGCACCCDSRIKLAAISGGASRPPGSQDTDGGGVFPTTIRRRDTFSSFSSICNSYRVHVESKPRATSERSTSTITGSSAQSKAFCWAAGEGARRLRTPSLRGIMGPLPAKDPGPGQSK